MIGKNFFLYSLLLSFVINFFLYFIFENKSAIGQGTYCQPLPYLTFSGSWPRQGSLVMTSSTPNVLVRYEGGTLITGSGSANYISKWTSASTLGNSIIYDNGTNVGIGTTNPAYKLDVSGNARVTGTLYAGTISGTYTGTINAANVSSGQFGANTGEGIYSFPGNVGIGTTGPTAKLHIFDGIATSTKLAINNADVSSGLSFYSPMTANFGWTRYEFGQGYKPGPSDGYYTITSQYNFTGIRDRNGFLQFIAALSPGAGTVVTDANFNSSYVRMTIANNGNVGIGTTNPTAKLHVKGATYFEGTDPTAPGIFAKLVEYGGSGRLYLGKSNLYGGDEVFMGGFGTTIYFASNRPGALGVWVNDGFLTVDRSLTVKSNVYLASVSGNVGIGTGSPSYKLEINGTLGYTGGTGPFCIFANACPNGWVDKGLGGYIYNSGGGATCPYSVGAAFNASWTWCHPRICCQW